jgi:phospholipid transport system transporter-binding protein
VSETSQPGVFAVSGRLTFDTVPAVLADSKTWFAGDGKITIDLSGVTLADSAGVALLLEWMEHSRDARRELDFSGFPEQLRRLIGVSGLNGVFGLAT